MGEQSIAGSTINCAAEHFARGNSNDIYQSGVWMLWEMVSLRAYLWQTTLDYLSFWIIEIQAKLMALNLMMLDVTCTSSIAEAMHLPMLQPL